MNVSSNRVPRLLIQHCCDEQCLVSIQRDNVSEDSHQGFILDLDEDWLLLQLIYDFQIDGLLLVRISDLTHLSYDGIDAFHQQLLEKDGILEQIDFDTKFPKLGNSDLKDARFLQFLRELPQEKVVILEDELDEDSFDIGFILEIDEEEILFSYFNGEAQIDPKPYEVSLDEITKIRIDSLYTLAYERHFKRVHQSN